MSIVTLSTKTSSTVPGSEPSVIKNDFRDGLTLKKGTEVVLLNTTITKLSSYEVVLGVNDTIIWRIGRESTTDPFIQHVVTLAPGSYSGPELVTELQNKLNESVLLGPYRNGWTASYNETTKFFTLNYSQSNNTSRECTWSTFAGGPLTFTNNGTDTVTVEGPAYTGEIDTFIPPDFNTLATTDVGVYANGGELSMIIEPLRGYAEADHSAVLISGAGDITRYDVAGLSSETGDFILSTDPTAIANGWTYTIKNFSGVLPVEYWVFLGEEGKFGITTNPAQTANEANSSMIVYWNGTGRKVYCTANNGGRDGPATAVGFRYAKTTGNYSPAVSSLGVPECSIGLASNYIHNGNITHPTGGNPSYDIDDPDCSEVQVIIWGNTGGQMDISLDQIAPDGVVNYPDIGWRQDETIFGPIQTANLSSLALENEGVAPTDWTGGYNPNADHVKVSIRVYSAAMYEVHIGHDTAGNGNFANFQRIASSNSSPTWTSYLKELMYPCRGNLRIMRGGWYFGTRVVMSGIYDDAVIPNNNPTYLTPPPSLIERELIDTSECTQNSWADPPDPMKLTSLYKTGPVFPDEIGTDPGDINAIDAVPNTANTNILLGTPRYQKIIAFNEDNQLAGTHAAAATLTQPTIHVELPQFNIKGRSGLSGDNTKTIHVIPGDELHTGLIEGSLHYVSQFEVPVSLNLENDLTLYDLQAFLRFDDGRIADDLITPTKITLLFREGEDTKEERKAKRNAELIASSMSNIFTTMLGDVGRLK